MNTFTLKILAASKIFYEGDCESIIIPTVDGKYGVEALHENAIFSIVPGEIKFRKPGSEEIIAAVSSGVLKFEANEAILLCDSCERPEDIDEERAKLALERAKEELHIKQNRSEYLKATAEMDRALARLKVKSKYKKI